MAIEEQSKTRAVNVSNKQLVHELKKQVVNAKDTASVVDQLKKEATAQEQTVQPFELFLLLYDFVFGLCGYR